jgi:hypothetical protein
LTAAPWPPEGANLRTFDVRPAADPDRPGLSPGRVTELVEEYRRHRTSPADAAPVHVRRTAAMRPEAPRLGGAVRGRAGRRDLAAGTSVSSLDDGDGILHYASGAHRTAAPPGVDCGEWTRRLEAHLAQHGASAGQRTGNPYEQGRHISGRLRTDQAEP